MQVTPEQDATFNDNVFDFSKTEKRLIRVSSKTFDKTGTYITLKVFKKQHMGPFLRAQFLSLTTDEWEQMINSIAAINSSLGLSFENMMTTQQPTETKKGKRRQPLQHIPPKQPKMEELQVAPPQVQQGPQSTQSMENFSLIGQDVPILFQ